MPQTIFHMANTAPARTRKPTTIYFYSHADRHDAKDLAKKDIDAKLNAYTRDASMFLAEREDTDRVVIMPKVPEHQRGSIRRTYADKKIEEPQHAAPKPIEVPNVPVLEAPADEEEDLDEPVKLDASRYEGISTARIMKALRKKGIDPHSFRGDRDAMIRRLMEG